ncbi:Mpo1 family 2-hydroxy fatty acid dioxygenase [Fulvivirga lutea]|uniref:DUF962 domain-containing protein n=1 Tax=Fulvivirga lutea TaxID=2810512 RepID=A0A974WH99_9BACT|nr:Mpo1-like protein [Fulvivirga lutea]QSE97688.1 DUF962 domain-containing protein [Fulvivirga lutea]
MRRIDELLSEYGESHQNETNKLIHWICVPSIFFSIVGLIWSIPSGFLQSNVAASPYANWATIVLVLVLAYYIALSWPLAIGMAAFSFLCLVAANALSQVSIAPLWALSVGIFVVAWIGQFYGHKVEGKKPSFFKDVQFLMIGPAWLMHFIFKKIGIRY